MSQYADTIYSYINMDYFRKLCKYIGDRFFKDCATLLDVGCGKGVQMTCFRELGFYCSGIDKRIETSSLTSSLSVKKCNVETDKFPFEDCSFDGIFNKSLLEHIFDPDNFFKECKRVLKQDGIIVIMTPDWHSQMKHFWDDYTHVHAYTLKSLKNALKINGFRNVGFEYFYQLPITWKHPWIKFILKIISIRPDSWKWKTREMENGEDRKILRFSKEKMLLVWGIK